MEPAESPIAEATRSLTELNVPVSQATKKSMEYVKLNAPTFHSGTALNAHAYQGM